MRNRNRLHITVPFSGVAEPYTPVPTGRTGASPPSPADAVTHVRNLEASLNATVKEARERKEVQSRVRVNGALSGIYIQFESAPDFELALASLEDRRTSIHPELRAVTSRTVNGKVIQTATVFVPDGSIGRFIQKFEQYLYETTSKGKRRNQNLVERIAALRLATLEALWTDQPEQFPRATAIVWWELWLRRRDGVGERLDSFAEQVGLILGPQRLVFEERVVVLVRGSAEQLGLALDVLDDIAELRVPAEPMQFVADLAAAEQAEFVFELAGRVIPPHSAAPTTCILDTGVAHTHPLIRPALSAGDLHACNPAWGTDDRRGHGTAIAGPALYGDVGQALVDSGRVRLSTRLESVKLLPDAGRNARDLYGALTAQAVALVEIARPERSRSFVMAVTAEAGEPVTAGDLGQPSVWSAVIDALSAGRAVNDTREGLIYLDWVADREPRLFVVSAGNVRRPLEVAHLDRSDLELVEDPAQSWNALTVGAYTEMGDLSGDETFIGWEPLAAVGELSPLSRTSVGFRDQWPYKPDVVLEGGNAAVSPDGQSVDTPGTLQVLTTRSTALGGRLLTTAAGTSPATAAAAYLVSEIRAQYPHFWPETVRALVVHSARWSRPMLELTERSRRRDKVAALRRYGWGSTESRTGTSQRRRCCHAHRPGPDSSVYCGKAT